MAMAGHPFVLGLADGTLADGCALLAAPSSSPDLLRPWVRMVSG
jgi:hypothetical protein